MSHEEIHLGQKYDVLLRLAKRKTWGQDDLQATLREVTEAAAQNMDIERVNVWLFNQARTGIHCIEHFQKSTGEHSSGARLSADDFPIYFKALDEERTIVANDAQGDPRTREFTHGYLDVNGITSMLDAPIHSRGEVIGIICHEHVGEKREWSQKEQQFAASLADLAALAMESSEHWQTEQALRESEQRTRKIITNALDAIIIADREARILDWNPRAETIFGWSRAEILGRTLFETIMPDRYHSQHMEGMQQFKEKGLGAIINRRIELSARDKTGREFPVELAVSPLRIGKSLAFSAFVRDITDRVQAELQVHKLNAELEERVHERTTQLRAAVSDKERLLQELQASSVELLDRLCELERKAEVIRNDLKRAQVIQRALLPAQPPQLDGVHVDALYRPGMNVGGDLYDVTLVDRDCMALYVADAAGHGVAAAMLSVLFKQRLCMRDENGHALPPPEVLSRVNARLADDILAQGLFLTVSYVLFNMKTGELRAASAGHTPMLVRRANGDNILLERTGPALGLTKKAHYTEHSLSLERGDSVILYTDGLMDQLDSVDAPAIIEVLQPALTGDTGDGPARLRGLFHDVNQRAQVKANGAGRDDVTLLMLQTHGGPSTFDNEPVEHQLQQSAKAPAGSESPWALWIAEDHTRTHLEVRGRGSWVDCENLRQLARQAQTSGRSLDIQLKACTHLDSAFLGTLHEVIASSGDLKTAIYHPSPDIHGFFQELGLDLVLAAIRDEAVEPPCEPKPVRRDAPARESQQRLLRAHEILSELSEENRDRFAGVVEALRTELGAAK